ncbi:hypothetical protein [Vibrio barjaei]|uniref:hypothetical protein n=1 Tax=Vibrio barjaei TaxID=1676683 RepID=UPI002283EBF1|nr:hypothetical protein [Vibrio barjaei]MCY9874039.1 hypothetical protein [Vibrio barjaei]
MEEIVFFVGLLLGAITALSLHLADRIGIEIENTALEVINFLSVLSTFALFTWGLLNIEWQVVVLAYVILPFVTVFITTQERSLALILLIPVTGLATVTINSYLWFFSH